MPKTFVVPAGTVFDRWTTVGPKVSGKYGFSVECRCDCGTERSILLRDLRLKRSRSCGCLTAEVCRTHFTTHGIRAGRRRPTEYVIWMLMKQRCFNAQTKAFRWYGARGITVCDEWRHSFEVFYKDMGARPSKEYSMDRINNDGNYEPGNCRWATVVQQMQNRRQRQGATAC